MNSVAKKHGHDTYGSDNSDHKDELKSIGWKKHMGVDTRGDLGGPFPPDF